MGLVLIEEISVTGHPDRPGMVTGDATLTQTS